MPYLGPFPLFVWGGVILLILVILQVLSGLHILKGKPVIHRINGFVILGFGAVHAILGILFFLGMFSS